jgi:hypothetical protein
MGEDMRKDREDAKRVKTTVMEVTPEQAEKWLKGADQNRALRDSRIFRYARDMEAGRWRVTNQAIALDEGGRLLDGQHRLHAITLAKVPVMMSVTRGVSKDAVSVIDEGLPRTPADALAFLGVPSTTSHAAALIFIWKALSGRLFGRLTPSRQELMALHDDLGREVEGSVREAMPSRSTMFVPGSMVTGMRVVCRRINKAKADGFFEAFLHVHELEKNHPVRVLNTRFAENRGARLKRRLVLTKQEQYALVIRAWNAYYTGEAPTRLLSVKRVGGELFTPEIAGLNIGKVAPTVSSVFANDRLRQMEDSLVRGSRAIADKARKARGDGPVGNGK